MTTEKRAYAVVVSGPFGYEFEPESVLSDTFEEGDEVEIRLRAPLADCVCGPFAYRLPGGEIVHDDSCPRSVAGQLRAQKPPLAATPEGPRECMVTLPIVRGETTANYCGKSTPCPDHPATPEGQEVARALVHDATKLSDEEIGNMLPDPKAPAPSLREALEAMTLALASAREMLGVFEDHGGHDGLSGRGYQATLDQMDDARKLANLALAQPAPAVVATAAREFLEVALSADEARLLMIGTNAPMMVRPEGKSLHDRCDAITEKGKALRAALLEATHG